MRDAALTFAAGLAGLAVAAGLVWVIWRWPLVLGVFFAIAVVLLVGSGVLAVIEDWQS